MRIVLSPPAAAKAAVLLLQLHLQLLQLLKQLLLLFLLHLHLLQLLLLHVLLLRLLGRVEAGRGIRRQARQLQLQQLLRQKKKVLMLLLCSSFRKLILQ